MVTPFPTDPMSGIRSFVAPRRQALLGFASGLLQGNDWGQGLGLGFERAAMGRQADDAYAQAQKAEQQRQAQINKTAEFLRKQGAADWADAVDAGAISSTDAYKAFRESRKSASPIKVGAGETLIDPQTMQPIYQGAPDQKEQFGYEKDLAGQYAQQDPVKTYQLVKGGYERVRKSAMADSGAGDVGLVYGFMKMLDPGSVVREGEFATAEQTAGIPQQIVGLYNRALSGERLTPEQRQQFVELADDLYQESSANLGAVNDQFSSRARGWGVDPSRFVVQPETFQPMPSSSLTLLKSKYGLD